MLRRSYLPYFFVALLHLIAEFFSWSDITIYTKPLLMPVLAVGFYFSLTSVSKNLPYIKSLLAALAFSTAGDVLLQFEKTLYQPLYFYFGLGAFLCAQCMYILSFFRLGPRSISKYWFVAYLLYFITFLAVLYPGMPLALQVPVTIYGLVLTLMAWQSWRSFKIGGYISVVGALFFVLSDSLLAINRFKMAIPQAGTWIMLTYLIAQFLIVRGATYKQH
ncbi:MAG: lysoplasmalogenase [Saprospiraceae bacterium]|nr:lysoplasmalogenase [Saprospiraceae bacterium]MBK6814012.1 lysoplasmalogenase [Saprospiraceae bacterium]MBK7373451.1 lysoplasmalogenase [Saprospiraceae bacterium]MBK7437122.1 lysoplasmalogenase [Saprospiraceae bacterium]MBK8283123.1 lysoplasmalogenase [Saprospiraceae bacterium]